jgi:hypothetical protein
MKMMKFLVPQISFSLAAGHLGPSILRSTPFSNIHNQFSIIRLKEIKFFVAKEADGEEYGRSGSPSLALNLQ